MTCFSCPKSALYKKYVERKGRNRYIDIRFLSLYLHMRMYHIPFSCATVELKTNLKVAQFF